MQEDVQENESESTLVSHQIPSLGLFDWILAAVAAALVFIGLSFLSFTYNHAFKKQSYSIICFNVVLFTLIEVAISSTLSSNSSRLFNIAYKNSISIYIYLH